MDKESKMRLKLKRDMLPEHKEMLAISPWSFEQLNQVCNDFQKRYDGFLQNVSNDVKLAMLNGMLVVTLFTCRESFSVTSREIRATYKFCQWLMNID
jgi:hypothetical protein